MTSRPTRRSRPPSRASRRSSRSRPRPSPATSTRCISRPATPASAPPPSASRSSRCSTTTRTPPRRWPSTASTAPCSRSPGTAPGSGRTQAWGGELLLVERGTFERLATFRSARARRRRPRRPRAVADRAGAARRLRPGRAARAAPAVPRDRAGRAGRRAPPPRDRPQHPARARRRARLRRGGRARPRPRAVAPRGADCARARQRRQRVRGGRGAVPFDLDTAGPVTEVDLRPLWRALAADVLAGAAPAIVSARFHAALVRAGVELVQRASRATGRLPVVLTGGCFQNARLAEGILAGLSLSFEVYPHGQVPPGDGGIALGQALVADARARPESEIRNHVPRCPWEGRRHRRHERDGGLLRREEGAPARHRRRGRCRSATTS